MVDYALQRRALLAEVYAGRTGIFEVCDAHPYLQRAARYHGQATDTTCPICRREQLTHVNYVYGEQLGATSGQAKAPAELLRMAGTHGEFNVYVVEVCRGCDWNHLTLSYVLGHGTAPPRTTSRRRAARE